MVLFLYSWSVLPLVWVGSAASLAVYLCRYGTTWRTKIQARLARTAGHMEWYVISLRLVAAVPIDTVSSVLHLSLIHI